MRSTIRNLCRLLQIVWLLGRYDAVFLLEDAKKIHFLTWFANSIPKRSGLGSPGERLAAVLQILGPCFIKFGQALSTRPDLVGDEVALELSKLQDRLPPFSGKEAKEIISKELGRPIHELFSEFNEVPVAAASIAQVHLAQTTEGDAVAVKVLRPGIEIAFARDIALFYWLAALSERVWRRLRPLEVIHTFADSVAMEMDLRMEAAAASEIRGNFKDDPSFLIPKVDWQRTSQRVLTLEKVEGIPIDEVEALVVSNQNPREILMIASTAFFKQIFRDGFFHADLHAGNLLVNSDGCVVAVDFGIMGRLDRKTKRYLAEMLLGFLQGNYLRVAEVHFEAGYVPSHKSKEKFTQALRSIGEPILGKPLNEISIAQLLGHLFGVTKTFEMETQPQLLLLQKTLLMAEGICRRLSPEENMWVLARPQIEHWAKENLNLNSEMLNLAGQSLQLFRNVPRLLELSEKALMNLDSNEGKRSRLGEQGVTNKLSIPRYIYALLSMLGLTVCALIILQFL